MRRWREEEVGKEEAEGESGSERKTEGWNLKGVEERN